MLSEQDRLFANLLRVEGGPSVFGFERWLADAATEVLGKNAIDASAYALARNARLWTALQNLNEGLVRRGKRPAFIVVDDRSKLFRVLGPGDHEAPNDRLVARDRPAVLRWIDCLSERQFEFLGGAMASLMGAEHVTVTPKGNEGGVDFYALVPAWGSSDIFCSPAKYLRVVGQSKYYTSRVGTDKSRELSHVITTIRHRGSRMEANVPDWFKSRPGPVVGAIVAYSGFQSGLVSDCHDQGIMIADAVDTAESLILSKRYRTLRRSGKTPEQILATALTDLGWT